MKRKAKVSLAYLHPGHVEACFHESLIELLFYDASTHGRLLHSHGKMGKRAGSGGIVDGRNQMAQLMLDESEADWLMMIDSDMGFAADTLERLIDAADPVERPVVGALCFAYAQDGRASFYGARWRCLPTVYDWVDNDDDVGFLSRMKYERDALQLAGATGAACMLVHRSALEKIRDKYGDVWFDPIVHPKGRKFSEDMSFCLRLSFVDLPLYVDSRVKTTHCKGAVFYDEEYFDLQELGRAAKREADAVRA